MKAGRESSAEISGVECSVAQPVEQLGRRVDAGDPGGRERFREGARDDPRTATDVHDPSDGRRVDPRALQAGRHGLDQRQHERAVDFERIRHRVPVEVIGVVMIVTVPAWFRTVRGHAHSRSPARALAAALATCTRLDFGVSSA